jgi:hypothetical protein
MIRPSQIVLKPHQEWAVDYLAIQTLLRKGTPQAKVMQLTKERK